MQSVQAENPTSRGEAQSGSQRVSKVVIVHQCAALLAKSVN